MYVKIVYYNKIIPNIKKNNDHNLLKNNIFFICFIMQRYSFPNNILGAP